MESDRMLFKNPIYDFIFHLFTVLFFLIVGIIFWYIGRKRKDKSMISMGVFTIFFCWCWPCMFIIWGMIFIISFPAWISDLGNHRPKPPEENNGRYN